jgi:hypothetical protein
MAKMWLYSLQYFLYVHSKAVPLCGCMLIFTQGCSKRGTAPPKMDHELPVAHCNMIMWTHREVMEWCSSTRLGPFGSPLAVLLCGCMLIFTQGCSKRGTAPPKMDHELPVAHCNMILWTHAEVMEWCSSTGLGPFGSPVAVPLCGCILTSITLKILFSKYCLLTESNYWEY